MYIHVHVVTSKNHVHVHYTCICTCTLYIIGRVGASPPSLTNGMIFLYTCIYIRIVRRALNVIHVRASFSPIFKYFSCYYNHVTSACTRHVPNLASHPYFSSCACAGKGGGGREGKIRLVRCARFSFRLPECWQSQSNSSIQSN